MLKLLRTPTVVVVVGTCLVLGFFHFRGQVDQWRIAELEQLHAEMEARLEAREEMIARLTRTRRVGHVEVTDQTLGADGETVESTSVRLIELDDDGAEIDRQDFSVPGAVLMIDAWTVKFEFDQVAAGHPLAGRTLVLLRRVYSDQMRPIDGFPIDTPGAVPPAYAVTDLARFQQKIWGHFWDIATDPSLARSMGVRVAQGEAVYKPVRLGQRYELIVDAASGMSLLPLEPNEGLLGGAATPASASDG